MIQGLGLSPAEQEAVLAICSAPPVSQSAIENRGLWLAAAWLSGASYRQLARFSALHWVTVRDHVQRRVNKSMERFRTKLSDAELARLWTIWIARGNRIDATTSPLIVASMLMLANTIDGSEIE